MSEPPSAIADLCPRCGAEISPRGRPRHRRSFRCYARSGQLRRDGWRLAAATGYASAALLTAWPSQHVRRSSQVARRSEGGLRFIGHARFYIRSPRVDVHLDVFLRALDVYRRQRRLTLALAVARVLALSAEELRRLSVAPQGKPSHSSHLAPSVEVQLRRLLDGGKQEAAQ